MTINKDLNNSDSQDLFGMLLASMKEGQGFSMLDKYSLEREKKLLKSGRITEKQLKHEVEWFVHNSPLTTAAHISRLSGLVPETVSKYLDELTNQGRVSYHEDLGVKWYTPSSLWNKLRFNFGF